MYDMFIGGVSGTLEPVATTALRELGEELGLGPYGGSSSGAPDRGMYAGLSCRVVLEFFFGCVHSDGSCRNSEGTRFVPAYYVRWVQMECRYT